MPGLTTRAHASSPITDWAQDEGLYGHDGCYRPPLLPQTRRFPSIPRIYRDCAVHRGTGDKSSYRRFQGGKKVDTIDRVDNAHSLHDGGRNTTNGQWCSNGGSIIIGTTRAGSSIRSTGIYSTTLTRGALTLYLLSSRNGVKKNDLKKKKKKEDCNIPRTCGIREYDRRR